MGIERRKYRRVDASSVIWYEITDMKRLQTDKAHVDIGLPQKSVDISLGGAKIFTTKPIEPDKDLKLILSIPGIKEPVSIAAKVVWCQKSREDEDYYIIGLQFMQFLNEKKAELAKYIEQLPEIKSDSQ